MDLEDTYKLDYSTLYSVVLKRQNVRRMLAGTAAQVIYDNLASHPHNIAADGDRYSFWFQVDEDEDIDVEDILQRSGVRILQLTSRYNRRYRDYIYQGYFSTPSPILVQLNYLLQLDYDRFLYPVSIDFSFVRNPFVKQTITLPVFPIYNRRRPTMTGGLFSLPEELKNHIVGYCHPTSRVSYLLQPSEQYALQSILNIKPDLDLPLLQAAIDQRRRIALQIPHSSIRIYNATLHDSLSLYQLPDSYMFDVPEHVDVQQLFSDASNLTVEVVREGRVMGTFNHPNELIIDLNYLAQLSLPGYPCLQMIEDEYRVSDGYVTLPISDKWSS